MKPFDDLCVLDLSQGVAGPYCTMYLADLGCQIIKVEPPWGDWVRTMGNKIGKDGSVPYSSLNRGKKSIVVDARTLEGREMLLSLATKSDILVESFRPGVMERLGLGWEHLQAINPSLIYCSISAFGPQGPYRNKKGTDSIMQGLSGIMSITGEKDGKPLKIGMAISDMFAGLLAAQSILSATILRNHDNKGKRIEISLMEALLELQRVQLTNYHLTGEIPTLKGNSHANMVPSRSFTTADGEIMVAVLGNSDWDKFCEALCLSNEVNTQYADPRDRLKHQVDLYLLLDPIFLQRTSQQWLDILEKNDILCGMIYNYKTLSEDPHIQSLDYLDIKSTPATIKSPIRFLRDIPWESQTNAPELGKDTEAIIEFLKSSKTKDDNNHPHN